MAYLITEAPRVVQDIWHRVEAHGFGDPWWHPAYGLYAYRLNAHMEDDREPLCNAVGEPYKAWYLGDPCVFCGQAHDDELVGPCPGVSCP